MTAVLDMALRVVVRTWRIGRFVGYFGYEFLKSNLLVLWEIVTPGSQIAPAVVELPLRSRSQVEIVSIGNLVALTPGTLPIEFVLQPPTLYVHGMFVHDPAEFRTGLHKLEHEMLRAMRPVGPRIGTDRPTSSGGAL